MVDIKSEVYYINHDPVLGWMSPDGQLIECSYAEHEMAAKDIVQISGWLDDDVPAHKPRPDKSCAGFVRPPKDIFF